MHHVGLMSFFCVYPMVFFDRRVYPMLNNDHNISTVSWFLFHTSEPFGQFLFYFVLSLYLLLVCLAAELKVHV